ncbi:Transcription factor Dp 1 [Fasciola hepatica]|uniref:Transcription factor Dp 1 n=1 Tax=Fasciola hepatica TaxID=6192 RepID=A0A4E0R379_FASHE|nr:Transcription factor Dp 1 [Fasciola hepatica]
MEFKTESYEEHPGDLFDIPAAEQEITVGSNEQTLLSSALVSPGGIMAPTVSSVPLIINSPGITMQSNQQGNRPPRVIMLQRTGPTSTLGVPGSAVRPGIKTVKIITVPGQGTGRKPLRAAVIPMHMLQRSMRMTSGGNVPVSGSSIMGNSLPRVLTIRSPAQVGPSGAVLGGVSSVGPVRPGTIILSGTGGLSHLSSGTFQTAEEVDNSIFLGTNTEAAQPPGLLAAPSGYYDFAAGIPTQGGMAGYLQPGSPSGRDSGDEQEHMPTGLKTNGLRRYARCVCNKVKEKGVTSYSEVADELVHEYAAEHPMIPSEQLHYIQKNIRRRVYDALNVLMALNVLQKEKKEIRWVGLPVNMIEECRRLEEEREKRQVSLRNKTLEIQDLILQLIAFKNLVMRNRINDRYRRSQADSDDGSTLTEAHGHPSGSSQVRTEKIPLPFLVISTNRKTVIDCNISNDKLDYVFNFDQAFEIRDEVDTLKRLGLMLRLGTIHCTQEDYNQCLELVPPSLRFYVEAIYERRQAIVPDFEALHQQRRLFVEARLAAAAANQAAGQTDENGDPIGPGTVGGRSMDHSGLGRSGLRSLRHSPMDTGAAYTSIFESSTNESTLRQLYLSRTADDGDVSRLGSGTSSMGSGGFVPGDTQHYARAAASRGYVVPGGPGGLLRHRQLPVSVAQSSSGNLGMGPRSFVTSERYIHDRDTKPALICSVAGGSREDMSSTNALVSGVGSVHGLSHGDEVEGELVDPDEEIIGEPDDDEDDEDDDDMEEV